MKRSTLTERSDRSVGVLAARMAVRKALRCFPVIQNRTAYVIGAELPDDTDTYIFEDAFACELGAELPNVRSRNDIPSFCYFIDEDPQPKYKRKRPFEAYSLEREVRENQRLVGMGTPGHGMPSEFREIAETVVEVQTDHRHIAAALFLSRGITVGEEQAKELHEHNLTNLTIAFRGNRPLSSALRMLRAMRDADESDTPLTRRTDQVLPLEQLHGYGRAKEWGLELATDLTDWRNGKLEWNDVDKGVLLKGVPGTGKTRFAKSLAESCNAHFVECSLAKTQAKGHLGDMLAAISRAFREACKNTPSILFVDECDSIGNRATLSGHHPEYARKVITGMLEFMDGAEPRDGVVVIAACNSLENIDEAFLRPGRLEQVIEIEPPDLTARKKILTNYLQIELPELSMRELGQRTEGWTGADIEKLSRDARRKARRARRALDAQQVLDLVSGHVMEISAGDLKRFAVHEAGHVVAAYHLLKVLPESVSIQEFHRKNQSGAALSGGVTLLLRQNASAHLRSDYLNEISVALAGHAAEKLILGEASDGSGIASGSDLEFATSHAARLLAGSGLCGDLVFRSDGNRELRQLIKHDANFKEECGRILDQQLSEVTELLSQRIAVINGLAEALLERKTLAQDEIASLLGVAVSEAETTEIMRDPIAE